MPLNWTEAHQEAMSQPATADSAASLTSSMHRHESGSDNSRGNSRPNSRDSVSFSSLRPQLDAQVNYYRTKHTHTHTHTHLSEPEREGACIYDGPVQSALGRASSARRTPIIGGPSSAMKIEMLDVETLSLVLRLVPVHDTPSVLLTCTTWRRIAGDEQLWRLRASRDLNATVRPPWCSTWHAAYRDGVSLLVGDCLEVMDQHGLWTTARIMAKLDPLRVLVYFEVRPGAVSLSARTFPDGFSRYLAMWHRAGQPSGCSGWIVSPTASGFARLGPSMASRLLSRVSLS